MKLLVVDCCIRDRQSRTKKLYEAFLKTLDKSWEIEILKLDQKEILPLTLEEIDLRDHLVKNGDRNHPMLRWANQFKEADAVIIAAPYWDISFPALLKAYLEQISVTGVTFGYEGSECVGYCKAEKILYLSTCGGFVQGRHLGAEYVEALAAMLGIHHFQEYAVEGLDIDPSKAEALMEKGIEKMKEEIHW